jgi:outer membrane lipoprotein-sorting protein
VTRVFPCLAVLLTLAVGAAPVSAQTVDEIIAKNIEAKGGLATLKATNTVRTTTRGTMQGAEISARTSSKRPFLFRNEAEMGGQKMIQGFDGETFWMAVGNMPARPLPPGPQVEALKQSSQIDSPLLDYKAKGTGVTLGEPVTHDGRKQHHLIVTPKTGPTMHYYIDAETNLESRMVIEAGEGGQNTTMELRFSDYKTVDGRTVPFTTTQYVNGNQVVQMQLQKVEFNIPLDDALFTMPKS